jgi:hypothetical protein
MEGRGARNTVEATPPSAVVLLDAWEAARNGELAARVASLLSLVHGDRSRDALLNMPLGQRNRALLALHATLVGPVLECVVRCPRCLELNELSLDVALLVLPAEAAPGAGLSTSCAAWTLRFRLPTTNDLVSCLAQGSLQNGRSVLAERCVLSVEPAVEGPLPDELIGALSQAIGEADPAAELVFHLSCVACQQHFTTLLDPSYVLWRELNDTGQRLLAEVDALARTYHWPEREILALSPTRRRMYLDLVDA